MVVASAKRWARGAARAAPLVALCPSTPVLAQAAAGAAIVNVAALHADLVGAAASNGVTLLVAERLDCTLVRADAPAAGTGTIGVVLTNTGNGHEAFAIAARTADGVAQPVAIDSDGDGRVDPARHQLLTGGVTPELAAGQALRLLVTVDPAIASSLDVVARATTGSGAPGLAFPGRGDGGGDAVVGTTGAMARVSVALAADAPPTIVETQAVLAADGSATARRGAVVTYTLVARFTAASAAASLVDPVPANTAYLPATLILDDVAIGDGGRVADRLITVPLGAVAAGSVHRLSFKAIIQ